MRLPVVVALVQLDPDHALGAGWFASKGVEVIAHHACRERMAAEHPALIASPALADAVMAVFEQLDPVNLWLTEVLEG